ncbi:MAG: hypothetical protein IPG17_25060 [Sandaracinaceae bacterium]|nr:hypothetical protein [Sandaracinaceae bacterium]
MNALGVGCLRDAALIVLHLFQAVAHDEPKPVFDAHPTAQRHRLGLDGSGWGDLRFEFRRHGGFTMEVPRPRAIV